MHEFDFRIMFQVCGAVLYITNYLLLQTHRIKATSFSSLGLVISACSILLTSAIIGRDWGLILLEGTWLIMVGVTMLIRARASMRRAVLEREAVASAGPARVVVREVPVREPVEAVPSVQQVQPVARELELAAAA